MFERYRKWLVLFATGIMIMLINLDLTIVNLAVADIAQSLHATLNQSQWLITSYMLATTLSFTLFGRIADIVGRKRIFLIGIFLFTVGSLTAALSNNIPLLLAGRFLQGLGFAATLGLSLVINFANFPGTQKGLAAGITVTITGVSQAIGPTIGGLIIQHLSWQWIFWINVPLGVLSFILTVLVVPKESRRTHAHASLNYFNASLFVLGLGLILYAINQSSELSWGYLIGLLVIGLVALGAFIHNTHRSKSPLINVTLLQHKGFFYLALQRFFFMMLYGSSLFIISLYLQNIRGFSPDKTPHPLSLSRSPKYVYW